MRDGNEASLADLLSHTNTRWLPDFVDAFSLPGNKATATGCQRLLLLFFPASLPFSLSLSLSIEFGSQSQWLQRQQPLSDSLSGRLLRVSASSAVDHSSISRPLALKLPPLLYSFSLSLPSVDLLLIPFLLLPRSLTPSQLSPCLSVIVLPLSLDRKHTSMQTLSHTHARRKQTNSLL